MFYPRSGFEFFLSGHLECFKHLGGLARAGRYDNLKSAVLRRKPQIEYNPQFLDFARFYRDFAASMPDQLFGLLRLRASGQTPFLPEELKGADRAYRAPGPRLTVR